MIFLGAILLLAASGFVCVAQVEQGANNGAILDAPGASIRATKITATNQAGALATSDATVEGYYKIPYLLTMGSRALIIEQTSSSLGYVTRATQVLELRINRGPYSMLTLSPASLPTTTPESD